MAEQTQTETETRNIIASGPGAIAAASIDGPVYGGGNTYRQTATGPGIAQAAGPGATATVKIIQLPPPKEIDLAVAERRLAELPVNGIPSIATLPSGSSVPYSVNPLFCGRQAELNDLATAVKEARGNGMSMVAVSGIGGVGKSQLAVEFAHRYGQYFMGGVYWMSFAEPGAIPAEITKACSGLPDLPVGFQELDSQTQLGMILGAWRNELPRLLIFDNCEEESLLEEWRPTTGSARVLLTSRRSEFDASLGVKVVVLETLPRADSVALLQKFLDSVSEIDRSPTTEADALPQHRVTLGLIAAELGDLPLALHVAGSFLSRYSKESTAETYLEQLRSTDPLTHRSLKRAVGRSPTKHELSVARTFELSYEKLDPQQATDRMALDLLARAACFAPGEPIPRNLLSATLRLPSDDPDVPYQVEDAYHRLAELGLLSTNEAGDPLLHRLLAHFVLSHKTDDMAQFMVEAAVLDEARQLNRDADPRPLRSWQVHLRQITDEALARGSLFFRGRLAYELGLHLYYAGDLVGAKSYLECSLAIKELGAEEAIKANMLFVLGMALRDMGDLAGARTHLEHSLAIDKRLFGERHQATAASLCSLGSVLVWMGDMTEAKANLEAGLAIQKEVLGDEAPETARSLNNLGMLLLSQGDLAGAKPYFERSLAIREHVLGDMHPYTAASLNALGQLLHAQGDLAGAKPYFERSLAIWEQVLGDMHPHTAIGLSTLGSLLYAMGDYEQAKAYLGRALTSYTARLGAEHPRTQAVSKMLDEI